MPVYHRTSFGIAASAAGPDETFAPVQMSDAVQRTLTAIPSSGDLDGRLYRVEGFERWPVVKRIAWLRNYVQDVSRDPAIARKAVSILKAAGAEVRDYKAQWAALLAWVQKNIYYVNEPGERFQSPQYTLTEKHGDCDDLAILLASLGHSIRLPFRFVISGKSRHEERVRWVEGNGPVPRNCNWAHIYLQVGGPSFKPRWWRFAEPTLQVPLGWDAMDGGRGVGSKLPELAGEALGDVGEWVDQGAAKVREVASTVPWGTVTGLVIASVASYAITKSLEKKWGKRRR